ncbi:MerR family transcriptional regulator [Chloroflexi bacterium TSY]|nr:MerR family transcriptional regulator [Chloroflexi bacterium TSY]
MLKIGQFAWLSQVTTETLRHYDRLGLLRPAQIDAFTGYRYYELEQLPRLYQILALRDIGLPLEQVAYLLDGELSLEKVSGMLCLKQVELERQIEQLQDQLSQVNRRLQQINLEGKMPDYEVVLKTVEPVKIASKREKLSSYSQDIVGPALGRMTGEAMNYAQEQNARMNVGLVLWHDNDDPDLKKQGEIDVEAAVTIEGDVASSSSIKVYSLPQSLMASAVHHGEFTGLGATKRAIFAWIDENDYQIAGPIREVYLQFDPENPSNHVTEVQFPVEKT